MSRAHRFSKHVFFNYGPEEGTAQVSGPEQDLGHPLAAARSYYWWHRAGPAGEEQSTQRELWILSPPPHLSPSKGTHAPRTRLHSHRCSGDWLVTWTTASFPCQASSDYGWTKCPQQGTHSLQKGLKSNNSSCWLGSAKAAFQESFSKG